MKKILWVAMVVLMALFVVGCADEPALSLDEHYVDEADRKIHHFEATYDLAEGVYKRSLLKYTGAIASGKELKLDINMEFPQYGKAGVAFGFTQRKLQKAGTESERYDAYSYYIFGMGAKATDPSKLEFYVDYNIDMQNMKGGEAEFVSDAAAVVQVVPTMELPLGNITYEEGDPITLTVGAKYDATDNVEKYILQIYSIKVGSATWTYEGKNELVVEIPHALVFEATEDASEGEFKLTDGAIPSDAAANIKAKGDVYTYGMVSGRTAGEKQVKTTWTLNETSTHKIVLSAEEE